MNGVAAGLDTGGGRIRAGRPSCLVMPPRYDDGRLGRLLRLLRIPAVEWVRRAQRIPLTSALLSDRDLAELGRRLEQDASFRRDFDADPVAAAEAAGLHEIAVRLKRELRELVALAEEVASDEVRRAELVASLGGESVPVAGAKPLLELLAVASDVEAHALDKPGADESLLLLLLTSPAVADELRAAVRPRSG
jgi:hypothetical protein